MAREPEQKDRRPPAEDEAGAADKSFSAACLDYLRHRARKPG